MPRLSRQFIFHDIFKNFAKNIKFPSRVSKFLPKRERKRNRSLPISSKFSIRYPFVIQRTREFAQTDSTNLLFYIRIQIWQHTVSRITRKLITTHPSSFKMIRTIPFSMSMSVAKFHAIPYILYESAFPKTSLRRRDHLIFRTILLRIVCRANHRDRHIFFRTILLSRFQLEQTRR